MTGEKVVDEMISVAATKAEITQDQSKNCITAALQFIQEQTITHGPIDLSAIGFFVSTRPLFQSRCSRIRKIK